MNYENLGNCRFCNAPNTRSRQTGKVYCSEKCWLQNQPQRRYQPPQGQTQRQEPDWDKINAEKEENMSWLNAKNNACQIVSTAIEKDLIKFEDIRRMIKSLAEYIYQLEPPQENENLPEDIE